MKLKITKEQARILENLNNKKVLKITEEQYKEILKLEGIKESIAIPKIANAFNADPKTKVEFFKDVHKGQKIKGVLHEDLWKEFVNELYGLNESGNNTYESLIKLMEAMGYVENRKLSKTIFEGDKDLAKKVITSGLAKLNECGSAYMAMEAMDEAFKSEKKNPLFKTFVDDWFAKGNQDNMVKQHYDNGDYWSAWQTTIKLGNVGKLPQNPQDMEVVSIAEIDGEETPEVTDEVDTITMDVPLFLRALEYSREDAKNDLNLHDITQNAVRLSKEYDTLTMDNYYEIFGDEENTDSVDDVMSENEQPNGVVGLDILNYPPFSNLPETRAETGDYTTMMKTNLPSLETPDANVEIVSKRDFVDYEFQGPKMMHSREGYINSFKRKFGEEPIFINIKDLGRIGSADIANEKFIEWRNSGIASKKASIDAERSAGTTYGLDEIEVDEATLTSSALGLSSPINPIGYEAKEIYEALNALKKKVIKENDEMYDYIADELGLTPDEFDEALDKSMAELDIIERIFHSNSYTREEALSIIADILKLDRNPNQLEEVTSTVTAGNYAYDTPGFAASEFMGTAGKKGKAPVSTKKKTPIWPGGKIVGESATDKTQWAGGAFVEFDDCTKLNNNKEAQKGGCSTGAVDNVVKLKKTASNVNAPSLGKKQ